MERRKPFLYNYFQSPEGGGKSKRFNYLISFRDDAAWTVNATNPNISDIEPRYFMPIETILIQRFPIDYDYLGMRPNYVCGMYVPPFVTQRIADQIARQWFGDR